MSSTSSEITTSLFQNALLRNPDPVGHAYWVSTLDTTANLGIIPQEEIKNMARAFFSGVEFQDKALTSTEYVNILYQSLLNRLASSGEVSYQVSFLNEGHSRSECLENILSSIEFNNREFIITPV